MSDKYLDYLSSCDLINKYNSPDIYSTPKLDKVVVEARISDLLEVFGLRSKDLDNQDVQIKLFGMLYLFYGIYPFVNSQKIFRSSKNQKTVDTEYSLKISFSKKVDINRFIFYLFVENSQNLSLEDFKLFKPSFLKQKTGLNPLNNKFVLNTIIPCGSFFEIENLLSLVVKNSNSKKFKLRVNFVFQGKSLIKNRINNIRNIPLFWLFS